MTLSRSAWLLLAAALWTLYCIVSSVFILRGAPARLRELMGSLVDDPNTFRLALDSFYASFLQTRLLLWFCVSVVLLLVALILRQSTPPE